MDATDDVFEFFLEVYGTLPRAGPGGDEHTLRALGLVPPPPPRAVLDLGCGPGAHTVALASALPASAWWVEYYEPMQDRIAALAKRWPDDPVAQQVVATATTEIARFQRFSGCYTYEFFVVQPTG